MDSSSELTWAKYKPKLQEILLFLPRFFRAPVQNMKSLPQWDWHTILTLHIAFGLIVGFLSGLFQGSFKFIVLFFQPIISSLSAVLIGALGTALFYYFILFYLSRKADVLRLYIMVAVATLPMLALRILSFAGPPITLIGFASTCFLCTVGLTHGFAVERKQATRLLGAVFGLFLVFWIMGVVSSSQRDLDQHHKVTPESLEILQQEIGK